MALEPGENPVGTHTIRPQVQCGGAQGDQDLASHPTAVCVSVCLNELANIKTVHKQV